MRTLALEFSSSVRNVAVLDLGSSRDSVTILGTASESAVQAVRPLTLVDLALQQAGIERESIECLVVALGPGSYTGIRSAIALAQGWQLAREVKLLGVSTAEGLAALVHRQGRLGNIGAVIDAQRDEFYFAGYEVSKPGWRQKDELHIATRREIPALAEAYSMIVGPDATKFFDRGEVIHPDAGILGHLAIGRADFVPGEKLEPIYLRETKFVKAPPLRVIPGL